MKADEPFDHNRLLKRVAAEMLEPLGMYQLGRSRSWIHDRAWWGILVSFGPSGFGRGTYLNVGVSLLWRPDPVPALGFDLDMKDRWKTPMGRFETPFIEARRPDWFERDVRAFADGAIEYVEALRSRPNDLRSFVARLDGSDRFWDRYHRAIGRGLFRDQAGARLDFARVVSEPNPYGADWIDNAQDNARLLSGLLQSPTQFEDQVARQVVAFRNGVRLQEQPEGVVLDSLRAAAA